MQNVNIDASGVLATSAASGSTTALIAGLSVNEWVVMIGLIVSILSFAVGVVFRFLEYRQNSRKMSSAEIQGEIEKTLCDAKKAAEDLVKAAALVQKAKK